MPFALSRLSLSRLAPHDAGRRIAAAVVLLGLAPLPSSSEPLEGSLGPDATDVRTYLECSVASEVGLLGFDEAALCSTVFMKIKLSFLPDVDLDTFNTLEPTEKSAFDRLGYRLYLDWKDEHADEIDALMTEIRSSQADS
jgi:hypothetical protein